MYKHVRNTFIDYDLATNVIIQTPLRATLTYVDRRSVGSVGVGREP